MKTSSNHRRKNKNDDREPEPTKLAPAVELTSSLYAELHKLAKARMRLERGNHTLQPTALVNEAYMRLAGCSGAIWQNPTRLRGLAAPIMRHILVDYARARNAKIRWGGAIQVELAEDSLASNDRPLNVLAVDEALKRLAEFDERQSRIVELHFFAGLTLEEIANELDFSLRNIKRDWAMARAWLADELSR